jgi:hypothetical protein
VISSQEIRGEDLGMVFPGTVGEWVSLPFDQILERSSPSMTSVVENLLYFIFIFAVNEVRRGSRKVWTMGLGFLIGGKK